MKVFKLVIAIIAVVASLSATAQNTVTPPTIGETTDDVINLSTKLSDSVNLIAIKNATNGVAYYNIKDIDSITIDRQNGIVRVWKSGKSDMFRASANKILYYYKSKYNVDYVDLGLSVRWATCNLGAMKPEEEGSLYQWGNIEANTDENADNKYVIYDYDSSNLYITKYCTDSTKGYNHFVDNKTTLDPSDDAAKQILGDWFHMPTQEEWGELIQNCTWTEVIKNGVKGQLGISKRNGNSIFIPDGKYWTPDLCTFPSYSIADYYALCVTIGNEYYSKTWTYGDFESRQSLQKIRPVYSGVEYYASKRR